MPKVRDWWKGAVFYQVYPRSFSDENGDGVGDLPGLINRLGYLELELGVDAIWVSPFFRSPMDDFGYDVSDYCDVDPIFGTLADARKLVEAVHDRGMKIVVDYVPNHCSWAHPWFQEASASRQNPKRDWFIWADAQKDGGAPNNWLSVFGGSAWTWHEETGQFYLHRFLKEQPDLNWRNPEVVDAMHQVLRFWLDLGVDGFRIDAPVSLMRDVAMRDNPPAPPRDENWGQGQWKINAEYESQLHLHDLNHPELHQVFRGMRKVLDEYDPPGSRVAIAEVEPRPWAEWVRYYGEASDEVQVPFNFELLNAPWKAKVVKNIVDSFEAALPTGCWPNYTLGNHDQVRLATRLGEENCGLAAMLLLTLRGTPTLYYGDELGMGDIHVPPGEEQDPYGKRVPGCGRDGCRAPMLFQRGAGHGFTAANVRPWLPFYPDADECSVEEQMREPRSIFNLYRRLLALRREKPALQLGDYEALDSGDEDIFLFGRSHEGQRLVVALNFGARAVSVSSPSGAVLISTGMDRAGEGVQTLLPLEPHEGVVVLIP